ncbi:VWA domain-containing protein [soil metagenome]
MIEFASPYLLWLLLAIPVVALLRTRKGPRAAIRYPSTDLVREVARTTRSRAAGLLPFLRIPAAALLIIALARPQLARATTSVQASGVDIMLAIDVSGSMGALDLKLGDEPADRLAVVKTVVEKFIAARPNDRLGMIAFAGGPYLVSPVTLDHEWLNRNIERVKLGSVEDGTAIGSALTAAVNRMRTSDAHTKIVVLLTDGVNNAGKVQPALAAEAAAALGIKVYTIGVGTDGEAPMPVTDDHGRRRLVMMKADVDEATLKSIADTTGGAFFRATDTESLEAIYQRIDQLEKTTREVSRHELREERFVWALLPGIGLLVLELGLASTLLRRVP